MSYSARRARLSIVEKRADPHLPDREGAKENNYENHSSDVLSSGSRFGFWPAWARYAESAAAQDGMA